MVAGVEVLRGELKMPLRRVQLALNSFLPVDIRIVEVRRVRADFDARFDASGKQYRYFIWNHAAMNPLLRDRAWHVP